MKSVISLLGGLLLSTQVYAANVSSFPIRVTGADAETVFALITSPLKLDEVKTLEAAGDHVTCVPGICRVGNNGDIGSFRKARYVSDSSGTYNAFLAKIGVPEVKDLAAPSLGLAGERRFNVTCVTEKAPGFDNGIAKVIECTLSESGAGTLNAADSAKVISVLPANVINEAGLVDTFVRCQIAQGDGFESQVCLYSKDPVFADAKLVMSAPIYGARNKWFEDIDRTQGQYIVQTVLSAAAYSSSTHEVMEFWNTSGRIICDTKKSVCQAMKF